MKITGKLKLEGYRAYDRDYYEGDIVSVITDFGLDYEDYTMLSSIIDKFINSSWRVKKEIHTKLIK